MLLLVIFSQGWIVVDFVKEEVPTLVVKRLQNVNKIGICMISEVLNNILFRFVFKTENKIDNIYCRLYLSCLLCPVTISYRYSALFCFLEQTGFDKAQFFEIE